MSLALYIVLESENPDFDTFVNGKSLAKAQQELDAMAVKLGVKPIGAFFSYDEDSRAFLEEEAGIDPAELKSAAATKWFAPADGIKTISGLLHAVQQSPKELGNSERIIAELEEFMAVLEKLAERGIRWHLAIDF